MKIVDVPAPIAVKIGVKGEVVEDVDFKKFLVFHLDHHAEIKSLDQLRQVNKIVAAVEGGNGTIKLEDADYTLLKAALQNPKYHTAVGRQLLPFYDAFDKAQEVKV